MNPYPIDPGRADTMTHGCRGRGRYHGETAERKRTVRKVDVQLKSRQLRHRNHQLGRNAPPRGPAIPTDRRPVKPLASHPLNTRPGKIRPRSGKGLLCPAPPPSLRPSPPLKGSMNKPSRTVLAFWSQVITQTTRLIAMLSSGRGNAHVLS